MGGYAGDTIHASVTYTATSRVAPVTEMRTVSGCWARTLQDAAWEPFVRQKWFPVRVMLNWNGFSVSVQYRDAQGNLSPAYCDDINVEGMPRPPNKAPAAAAPTTPIATSPAAENEIFKVWSFGVAYNGATRPTTFSINESWLVTDILTYHWNSAQGAPSGTIGLRASDGTTYGPWQAIGQPGQLGVPNAAWVVKPNIVIPPGIYTVLDSDPGTWAQNDETHGAGMARGYGIRQSKP